MQIQVVLIEHLIGLEQLEQLDALNDETFLSSLQLDELFPAPETEGDLHFNIDAAEKTRAEARRDQIATAMWNDYVQVLRERGEVM